MVIGLAETVTLNRLVVPNETVGSVNAHSSAHRRDASPV